VSHRPTEGAAEPEGPPTGGGARTPSLPSAPGRLWEASHRVVETARRLFGASAAVLYRVEQASEELTVVAAVDRNGVLEGPWPSAGLGEGGFTRVAVRSRETTWTRDLLAEGLLDPGLRALGERVAARGALAAPLLIGNRVTGLLVLHGEAPGSFGDAHVEPAQAFAEHAATSLETANLAEALEALVERNAGLVDALKASEARYRAVVDAQAELICRCLADGTLTFVNEAYRRYFDSAADAVSLSFYDHVLDEDRELVRRHLAALTAERPTATLANRVVTPRGEVRWLQWTARAIFDAAGRLIEFQSVGRDVTDQRRLEERLRESQKMDAVGQLAGGIAHDFNNLLTIVMGGSHLLLADLPQGDPRRAHVEAIARAADEAAELVRQLLAFARRQPVVSRSLDPDQVLAGMAGVLRGVVREDIELVVRPGTGGARVRADAGQIEQVVLNLVLNACDAMPRGGRLEIGTDVVAVTTGQPGAPGELEGGRYVVLTVRDTGGGMMPDVRARVFEPFFTTKERGGGRGRGLGLSVVYGIVRQSGGAITVDSVPGRGTAVSVYLARVAGEPTDVGDAETRQWAGA
jgi:PAS domain S-box-containing protein